ETIDWREENADIYFDMVWDRGIVDGESGAGKSEFSSEDVKCIKVRVTEGERFGYILHSSGKWIP
ncbi:MAG: hypothetical protein K0R78_3637, partial [Pelosinus sp.]|nr:hypothetical protein [Pelosinus sp.]